ncbi:MAG: hypothetical protein V4530_16540 [Pseudomonadota bacterium]
MAIVPPVAGLRVKANGAIVCAFRAAQKRRFRQLPHTNILNTGNFIANLLNTHPQVVHPRAACGVHNRICPASTLPDDRMACGKGSRQFPAIRWKGIKWLQHPR